MSFKRGDGRNTRKDIEFNKFSYRVYYIIV